MFDRLNEVRLTPFQATNRVAEWHTQLFANDFFAVQQPPSWRKRIGNIKLKITLCSYPINICGIILQKK